MKEIVEFKQGFKPKGKVTVQLFDENGKIINERKAENFIAKTVQGYFDHVMRNIFTRNRATGGHQLYSYTIDPFHSMILTDATHPEDSQNEWVRAGNVIGYAHTTGTYSGNDPLRGSYNLVESFTNREQVHIVVDFPTHAGNGTFQSIYFSSEYDTLSNASEHKVSNNLYYKFQKHDGKIYARRDTSTLCVLDDDFNEIEQIEVGYFYDFWIVGNVIYYAYNYDITSAPISDPTNRTLVVTLDDIADGIVRHELSGRWYTKYSSTIYVYDNNWNLLSSFVDINGSSSYVMAGSFDEGVVTSTGTFIWVGGEYNNNMTTLHGSDRSLYRMIGFFDGYTFYHYYGSTASNRYTLKTPIINIGSRVLLDQPVIKTANNTMKVTYDFMLPSSF